MLAAIRTQLPTSFLSIFPFQIRGSALTLALKSQRSCLFYEGIELLTLTLGRDILSTVGVAILYSSAQHLGSSELEVMLSLGNHWHLWILTTIFTLTSRTLDYGHYITVFKFIFVPLTILLSIFDQLSIFLFISL